MPSFVCDSAPKYVFSHQTILDMLAVGVLDSGELSRDLFCEVFSSTPEFVFLLMVLQSRKKLCELSESFVFHSPWPTLCQFFVCREHAAA